MANPSVLLTNGRHNGPPEYSLGVPLFMIKVQTRGFTCETLKVLIKQIVTKMWSWMHICCQKSNRCNSFIWQPIPSKMCRRYIYIVTQFHIKEVIGVRLDRNSFVHHFFVIERKLKTLLFNLIILIIRRNYFWKKPSGLSQRSLYYWS